MHQWRPAPLPCVGSLQACSPILIFLQKVKDSFEPTAPLVVVSPSKKLLATYVSGTAVPGSQFGRCPTLTSYQRLVLSAGSDSQSSWSPTCGHFSLFATCAYSHLNDAWQHLDADQQQLLRPW